MLGLQITNYHIGSKLKVHHIMKLNKIQKS